MRSPYTGWRIILVILALPFVGYVVQACIEYSVLVLDDAYLFVFAEFPAIVLLSVFTLTFWIERVDKQDDYAARQRWLRERAAQRDERGEL